jgi:hypothetical protein
MNKNILLKEIFKENQAKKEVDVKQEKECAFSVERVHAYIASQIKNK